MIVNNICKKREWKKEVLSDGRIYYDHYFIYDLKKKELGNYLNTWFVDGFNITNNIIYRDSLATLKKVDSDTASHLYNRPFNPLSIFIMPNYKSANEYLKVKKENEKKKLNKKLPPLLYTMKCHLHSVDDSSYGIWWDNYSIDDLRNKRFELMNWINQFDTKNLLNGENLLDKCIELGATPDSKDYN